MSGFAVKRCTLVVQDIRRSLAFYRDVLGLVQSADICTTLDGKIVPAGLPGAHVHLIAMEAGRGALGLLQWTDPPLAKPEDPYPIHLGIGDCAFTFATTRLAEIQAHLMHAHEARLHEPAPADGVCFFDPDGFFFALRKAENPPAQLARTTLIVRDPAASLAFYRDTLGLPVVSDTTGPKAGVPLPAGVPGAVARSVVLNGGAAELELLCFIDPAADAPDPPRHHVAIGDTILIAETDDLQALHRRVSASAGRLHAPPTAAKPGAVVSARMSFFDPDGYFFEVTAPWSA